MAYRIIRLGRVNMITDDTRKEAHGKVDKEKRYKQILECMNGSEMTAKETAVEMFKRGYIPTSERNFSAPRLTELEQKGLVKVVGKKKCEYTGKTVAIYKKVDKVTFINLWGVETNG